MQCVLKDGYNLYIKDGETSSVKKSRVVKTTNRTVSFARSTIRRNAKKHFEAILNTTRFKSKEETVIRTVL